MADPHPHFLNVVLAQEPYEAEVAKADLFCTNRPFLAACE